MKVSISIYFRYAPSASEKELSERNFLFCIHKLSRLGFSFYINKPLTKKCEYVSEERIEEAIRSLNDADELQFIYSSDGLSDFQVEALHKTMKRICKSKWFRRSAIIIDN